MLQITVTDLSGQHTWMYESENESDLTNWLNNGLANGWFGTCTADPSTYTTAITDVTAQLAQQALAAKGLQCQNFGATVIAQVYAFNEQNMAAQTLTLQQFEAMLADTSLANIERCLWNGSLNTALTLINSSSTISTYFSSAQISTITSMITNSGLL